MQSAQVVPPACGDCDASARAQHAAHFTHGLRRVWQVIEHMHGAKRIKATALKRQLHGIGQHAAHRAVMPGRGDGFNRLIQHRLGAVEQGERKAFGITFLLGLSLSLAMYFWPVLINFYVTVANNDMP